ncbi:PTS system ascorbate-specific IIA component [Inhella inkyongensis]|uniref:PTS system ascorbate-specific IIA component n=1 Tax=Inhella inkyongensis TaxID=392593 RepID=A0A840SCX1_9BURK|nr:PTS fructose transporter subunit IIA [Inhella inkyongensis]MBB5206190.1 PTS system ascorbate-specific IIA component [Inhella inkyongensis]
MKIILVAHAPLASALLAVAQHVFPQCAQTLSVLDVAPEWDQAVTLERIQSLLPPRGEVLLLVDVLGATPGNAAQALADGRTETSVVGGVNVPMLWRSLCYAHESLSMLADRAREGGQRGIAGGP